MPRQDFILNADGDFPLQDTVENGVWKDTPYGNSDQQHIKDLIFYDKGWLKLSPTIGFGAKRLINSEYSQRIESTLKECLQQDGYDCRNGVVYPVAGKNTGFAIDTDFIFNTYE